jgi:uncharacterized protein (DUF2132 family)
MDTENNQENKPADKPNEVEASLEPKAVEGQDETVPAIKVKRQATQAQLDHPLHGVKLAEILERLVEHYGWEYLAKEVKILCFKHNPTMKVSLKFLRKFKWAREHVEDIYMDMLEDEVYQKMQAMKKGDKKK